jgi:hypothetical protein
MSQDSLVGEQPGNSEQTLKPVFAGANNSTGLKKTIAE